MRSNNNKKSIHPSDRNSFKVNKKNRIYRNQWVNSQWMPPTLEAEILPEKLFLLLYLTSNYFSHSPGAAFQKPEIGGLPLLFSPGARGKGN
ncbi:glucosylglycerol biosynthesis transcriptional repressor GgpR [Synechocystis sp. PCC 7339]|uniref:glucosylglycerol biosynthesis transcriptional repressor GgpR n=1 Tax=Synechocystis sp. PCC 7339 TaxID=2782213 RepID=UPI00272D4355|nr:glucosylglycerol biosynthesis transcriptional repressor GgpR [Synechocystis sp. PCC 7339]